MMDHDRNCVNKKTVKYANSVVGHAEIISKYNKKYGPIHRGWSGSRGTVTVSSPEAAEVKNLYSEASTFLCPDTNGSKALLLVAN
jgi:hypothetical protein